MYDSIIQCKTNRFIRLCLIVSRLEFEIIFVARRYHHRHRHRLRQGDVISFKERYQKVHHQL